MSLLYDAVAGGMWAYSHAAFRVVTLGPEPLRLVPGTLIVATHRRETDVPVVGPPLYLRAGLWRSRDELARLSFAARDDLFLPGFVAGFPTSLPPRARRTLFPVGFGRWLPSVHVHPLRSASVARLGEALRERPDDPLEDGVEPAMRERLLERACRVGLREPTTVRDVLRGEYGDLLWEPVTPRNVAGLETFWARRTARASDDFRALVGLLEAGGRLLVFPEGRPSPDGAIGPLQRGLGALVRRGRPAALVPVAVAYDPLVRGRTRAVVAIGDAAVPPSDAVEEAALALLRATMPLTAGQIVAAGVDPDAAVADAKAADRPVDPRLLDRRLRRAALAEAAGAAAARPEAVAYLAREYATARR